MKPRSEQDKVPSAPSPTRRQFLYGALGTSLIGCAAPTSGSTNASSSEDDFGSEAQAKNASAVFLHGVASGDPFSDSVMLWTRVESRDASAKIGWEVATDATFSTVVAQGEGAALADNDHCFKVEARGLQPATTYFYRFRAYGASSPIGRTRTAPTIATRLRFAVCSCSSLAHGYFHAYRQIAQRNDLDAVIHLGDYVYEYGSNQYGNVRTYDPPHEAKTLDDYRRRYRHYRKDPDLQEVHRQHPFITTWDDHESANNAYELGAQNHTSNEGSWGDRKAAAKKAYFEWMPIRDFGDKLVHRYLRYGNLAELIVLDTRLEGRDKQAWGTNDYSWQSPYRQLLGQTQEAFLRQRLGVSTGKWKIICQQVMLAQRPHAAPAMDAWDGYPAQQKRVYDMLANVQGAVVLTGDVHSSWANDVTYDPSDWRVYDPKTGRGSLAVEMVAPAISSAPWKPEQAQKTYEAIAQKSPHIKFAEVTKNGYFVLDIDNGRAQGAWYQIDDVTNPKAGAESLTSVWATTYGERCLRKEQSAAAPIVGRPMLAP